MTNYTVGQYNTGCENKVKQRLAELLGPDWTEAFEHCVNSVITIAHQPQPHFVNIGVEFDVSIDPSGAIGKESKHFKSDFIVTIDEVRNLTPAQLDKALDSRSRACLIDLKAFIDQVKK